MLSKQLTSTSPKNNFFAFRVNPSSQVNYKQRANVLFDKLNTFKTSLQNQKHSRFSEVFQEIHLLQNNLEDTTNDKQKHLEQVIDSLSVISKELNHHKTQYQRFHKILENIIEHTNRQTQIIFDKMTRERENNQNSIEKYIDFKIESFVLKNKGIWLQQDLLNFAPYKEELNYLKKEVKQFYKSQCKQAEKLKKEVSENLQKQKEFLLSEMNRSDHEDIMAGIEAVYNEIRKKVVTLTQNRQNVEHNVLSMIENVVNSYIRDSNNFK